MKILDTSLYPLTKEQYKNATAEERKYAWKNYQAKRKFRTDKGKDKRGSY